MILRLGSGLGFFLGALALGWWLRRRGILTEPRASAIVRFVVAGPSPVVLCLLFWGMDLGSLELWLLPLLGVAIAASTLAPAWLYARWAKLPEPETGTWLVSAFFSNLGYLGGFAAYAAFGEAAYGLCMLYLVFFSPCFYTLGFWIGLRYGHQAPAPAQAGSAAGEIRFYPFLGMLAGIGLSLASVPRPGPLEWVNRILIPADTALYLMAAGSQVRIISPRPWLRECLVMSGIKFLYTPLVAFALLEAAGIQGLTRTIVLLEASTPVAVSALVLPLVSRLDRALANALWLFTTCLAVPWLLMLIPLLSRL